MSIEQMFTILSSNTLDTLLLTAGSTLLAYVIGLPLGVILILTAKDGIHPNAFINAALGFIVNILRSIPSLKRFHRWLLKTYGHFRVVLWGLLCF